MTNLEKLKKHIEISGASQTAFSSATGISTPVLSLILNGKRKVNAGHAMAIERETGIDFRTWFDERTE